MALIKSGSSSGATFEHSPTMIHSPPASCPLPGESSSDSLWRERNAASHFCLPPYWLALLWIVAALVLASHRPSSLLHAQFWAEDGSVWYGQAYQQGPFLPLLRAHAGYFQTVPRLMADVSLILPLHQAPLIMNLQALLLEGLPVAFLLSRRARRWGSLWVRAAMAVIFVCLPNSAEWHANATNAQWVLALLAAMVLLAELPEGWPGRISDLIVLSLCGLTGPFAILLTPVAFAMARWRKGRWRLICALVVLLFALLQGWTIYAPRYIERPHQQLGASVPLLVRILGVRIFAGSVLGSLAPLASLSIPLIVPLLIVVVGGILVVAGLWRAPLEVVLFVLFSAGVLAAALSTPVVTLTGPQWPAFLASGNARYYLLPMLAFLLCAGRVALYGRSNWLRAMALSVFVILPLGIVHNWQDYRREDFFTRYRAVFPVEARQFEAAPRGTVMTFPIEPAWSMSLTKR
jgi:hypothetical protein